MPSSGYRIAEVVTMNRNVGSIDRAVRIIVGIVLIALVFVGPQTPWGWIGLLPLATALVGWCPAYSLFGIRTCKARCAKGAPRTGRNGRSGADQLPDQLPRAFVAVSAS